MYLDLFKVQKELSKIMDSIKETYHCGSAANYCKKKFSSGCIGNNKNELFNLFSSGADSETRNNKEKNRV